MYESENYFLGIGIHKSIKLQYLQRTLRPIILMFSLNFEYQPTIIQLIEDKVYARVRKVRF